MLDEETMHQSFDDRNNNKPGGDFARMTYFDKSAAFGFGGGKDNYKLGRMAEENKHEMHKAIHNAANFRHTNAGFNKRTKDGDITTQDLYTNQKKQPKSPMY
jgi:hypothetical protein